MSIRVASTAVLMLAARRHTWAWMVAILATAAGGGAALTFWMGIKIGAHEPNAHSAEAADADPAQGRQRRSGRPGRPRSDSSTVPIHAVHFAAGALEACFDVLRHADHLPSSSLRRRGGSRAGLRTAHSRVARLGSIPRHRRRLQRARHCAHRSILFRLVKSSRTSGRTAAADSWSTFRQLKPDTRNRNAPVDCIDHL